MVVWGNGSELSGSMLLFSGTGVQVGPTRRLISDIDQYHYHVIWLAEIERYFVMSRQGFSSETVLGDRQGEIRASRSLPHPLIREARPAVRWRAEAEAFKVAYPTLIRDVALLRVESDTIIYHGGSTAIPIPCFQGSVGPRPVPARLLSPIATALPNGAARASSYLSPISMTPATRSSRP
ncbi:MAG: hypothetical protein CME06_10835 [Gemmatimonadetes bacterium]|nr:hypothetical protein [Gemmatimonadota bacterium]